MQNEDTIRNLVDIWMGYENYESADDAAEQLALYYRIIPDEFKKAPEVVGNMFYRAVAIKNLCLIRSKKAKINVWYYAIENMLVGRGI